MMLDIRVWMKGKVREWRVSFNLDEQRSCMKWVSGRIGLFYEFIKVVDDVDDVDDMDAKRVKVTILSRRLSRFGERDANGVLNVPVEIFCVRVHPC